MENNLAKLEAQIRHGHNLHTLGKTIEQILTQNRDQGKRNYYLYLMGLILSKQKRTDQAIEVAEQAVSSDKTFGAAYFLLYKLYSAKQYYTKASECLTNCLRLSYKKSYCKRVLTKSAYRTRDFVAAVNYLSEYQADLSPKIFWNLLGVDCLYRLGLYPEARFRYDQLTEKYRIKTALSLRFQELFNKQVESKNESIYQSNLVFFKNKGLEFTGYREVRFKVVSDVDQELIYDCMSGRFTIELAQIKTSNLEVNESDTLMISNTDNIRVFERLEKILHEVDSKIYRKRITAIPVYVYEKEMNNWLIIMQLFDFNTLSEWYNMHFWVGLDDPELRRRLSDESASLPNIVCGMEMLGFTELLQEIKSIKDQKYQTDLEILKNHYQESKTGTIGKILLITSIYNDTLFLYGKSLRDFLTSKGYNCYLYHETAPYYKFTHYSDTKLLREYCPDLVIHLFGVQEELRTFTELNVPFISWLLFSKNFRESLKTEKSNQFLLLTGDNEVLQELKDRGFQEHQMKLVPLPFVIAQNGNSTMLREEETADVGVITDLYDLDLILRNIVELAYSVLSKKETVNKNDLVSVFKEIYFEIYTSQFSQDFARPKDDIYQKIIGVAFNRQKIKLDEQSTEFFMNLLRRELENSLLKLLQVKWVIQNLKDIRIALYGDGWEKDLALRGYVKGSINALENPVEYHQLVLRNKINLFIGNHLYNNSFMQPDLINGIAAGGFFLANDLLVKEYGEDLLRPFDGLLITYGSREELLEKINYYLKHENERLECAKKLQAHILRNFTLEKVAETLLNGAKGFLCDNLN